MLVEWMACPDKSGDVHSRQACFVQCVCFPVGGPIICRMEGESVGNRPRWTWYTEGEPQTLHPLYLLCMYSLTRNTATSFILAKIFNSLSSSIHPFSITPNPPPITRLRPVTSPYFFHTKWITVGMTSIAKLPPCIKNLKACFRGRSFIAGRKDVAILPAIFSLLSSYLWELRQQVCIYLAIIFI